MFIKVNNRLINLDRVNEFHSCQSKNNYEILGYYSDDDYVVLYQKHDCEKERDQIFDKLTALLKEKVGVINLADKVTQAEKAS